MSEDKARDRFVRLAESRVSKALKDIKLIGNLSNRSHYTYTDEDVKKINQALKRAVDDVRSRFDNKGDEEKEIFKL
ncbi:hypothetical protein [Cobetia amphilecti]|uniref:hypothetical protein n=1 Tax=Cobetia amphilecti TaxID=1055104 RepID=UPI002448E8C8|nr:hypothetical protein [Cobetia litoralis]MDH2420077.1 hypothetical protein [Cobetia litoralis]MDH2422526.1 hypothetical protein [Cobetia litoralis]